MAWERHRRSIELAKYFDTRFVPLESTGRLRRAKLGLRTIRELVQTRPSILFVQNPSAALTLISVLLRPLLGYRLIVDAHNAAIQPEHKWLQRLHFLLRWIQAKADYTIVTNEALARIVASNGGVPLILPDRVPSVPPATRSPLVKDAPSVLFICTWAEDEPFDDFLRAVDGLSDQVSVFVTGRLEKIPEPWRSTPPSTVTFTGFLPETEYWALLQSVDLVVDLTEREDCLVCGAYEAVAVGKPLLLSDTTALRTYFRKGTVFSENQSSHLREALGFALHNLTSLEDEMVNFRPQLRDEWEANASQILRRLVS